MSERLLAKIPHMAMWLSLKYTLEESEKSEIDIRQQGTGVHLRDDVQSWLNNNCTGVWRVVPSEWKLEFDKKEDYVNFCLNWYDRE